MKILKKVKINFFIRILYNIDSNFILWIDKLNYNYYTYYLLLNFHFEYVEWRNILPNAKKYQNKQKLLKENKIIYNYCWRNYKKEQLRRNEFAININIKR